MISSVADIKRYSLLHEATDDVNGKRYVRVIKLYYIENNVVEGCSDKPDDTNRSI